MQRSALATKLYRTFPGYSHTHAGILPTTAKDLEAVLELGMDWSLREGYAWAEDKEHCEEYGRMLGAGGCAEDQQRGSRRVS